MVTPLGRFSAKRLTAWVAESGIEPFARQFFLWNEVEQEAGFYRNRALNQLWEHCCFAPSFSREETRKMNTAILDDLEHAWKIDHTLPLPIAAYQEICALANRKPVIPANSPELESEYSIGYRRGMITHALGPLRLTLPGTYQYEWEEWEDGNGTHLWREPVNDSPVWRMNIYQIREGAAQFSEDLNELEDLKEQEIPGGSLRYGQSRYNEDGERIYQLECEVIAGPIMVFITVTFTRKKMMKDVVALIKQLSMVVE